MLCSDVEDELSALSAIYDTSLAVSNAVSTEAAHVAVPGGELRLPLQVTYQEEAVIARFSLPIDYPASSPELSLQMRNRDDRLSGRVLTAVKEMLGSEIGNVALFSAIELVRTMVAGEDGDDTLLAEAAASAEAEAGGAEATGGYAEEYSDASTGAAETAGTALQGDDGPSCPSLPPSVFRPPTEAAAGNYDGPSPDVEVFRGETTNDRGSSFLGHFARVTCMQDVISFREIVLSDKKVTY
jgi:hypothetical protein